MAFYAPRQYLSLEDLAKARGVDPKKYTVGIGIKEAAVALPAEDVVVLAANAGQRVLAEAGVSPNDVGLLIVGTESAEDKSKPTATHVHDMLNISNACRVYDIVHACAGATYGVLSAIDWLQNDKHKYALVIASDIARYGKNNLGEPTQGAGAVAMLLSREPRLLALSEISTFSQSVYDFWKPMHETYPLVDGMYSTQCYVEAAENCFAEADSTINTDAAFLYHMPYPKLVQQVHSRIARKLDGDLDISLHFEAKVASSRLYPERIGNIYTGSVWLALMSFLGTANEQSEDGNDPLKNYDGCYLFSYGSGSGAVLLRGKFMPPWADRVKSFGFDEFIENRTRVTIEEYERSIDYYENPLDLKMSDLAEFDVGGNFRYLGLDNNKRQYGAANT
jgi:hydroxymethylglutaryl-CoA synthase